ncbi:hypothetical protein DC522_30525 [Microvirga sp. KLBC 81]|uniref:hypothetical protein n=1 Tax=Microvirga sp. KLBC 81 TaxID=1862707 RepID=UPI000D51809E|nr:hypothetical protein [Microvirga sp. KLBC 81]PVE20743.1 hypothetical protein DC522_30525 [Microvirga sp. KLBC 81]
MARYFFHQLIGDQMMWDRLGCELLDLDMAPDPDGAIAPWTDLVARRVQPGRILVITDEIGKVLFVTAR